MMQILELRARLKIFYQRFKPFVDPVLKFIIGLVVFSMINRTIGYDDRFNKVTVVLLLSLLSAFVPSSITVLLAMVLSIAHVYKAAPLLAILMVFVFLILYLLFVRYTPKLGYVVLGIPVLFGLHIPYVFPLVLGLIATPLAILPAGCGVIVYYVVHLIKAEVAAGERVSGLEDVYAVFTRVIDSMVKDKQMILTVIVFALIITVVYLIRRLKVEYASEVAVGAGAVTSIIGFLIVDLNLNLSKQILSMIIGTVISAFIVIIINFFRRVLDYTAVENVQFEDDDYYYYVKAVPKINVSMTNVKVKHINEQKSSSLEDDEYEEEDEDMTVREMDRRILESRTREARSSDHLKDRNL